MCINSPTGSAECNSRKPAQANHFLNCPIDAASSTGRCNTIQCIDSTMLAGENHLLGSARFKPSQGSVPAGPTLTSDLGVCFQCRTGSSLVLRRPIEITCLVGN